MVHHLRIPSPEADKLVVAAKASDADAFAQLYRATLPTIFSFLSRRCGDTMLAEDLCSDAYIKAVRSIGRFEGSSKDFVAWMTTIARNLLYDHAKSGRIRWELSSDSMPNRSSKEDPEADALAALQSEDLRRALEQLTHDQQEVLELRFLQSLSIAEVAEVLGRNEGAIKAMQFRALRALNKVLGSRNF